MIEFSGFWWDGNIAWYLLPTVTVHVNQITDYGRSPGRTDVIFHWLKAYLIVYVRRAA